MLIRLAVGEDLDHAPLHNAAAILEASMWNVTGTTVEDGPADLRFVEIENLISRDQVLVEARRLFEQRGDATPLATLEREIGSDDPLPGIDGIETWGSTAIELLRGPEFGSGFLFGRVGETESGDEVKGLTWIYILESAAAAFHSPEAIVANVSGFQEIHITGAAGVDEERGEPLHHRSFLEWRAYLGNGTLIVEGESEFEQIPGDHEHRTRAHVRLLGSVGVFVGRILHWMGKEKKPSHDPSFFGRLKCLEAKHPEVAEAYPPLLWIAENPWLYRHEPKPGPTLVLVHGTFSCAIPNLALLHPLAIQTFRFEHDTFQSISANAEELVNAVRKLPKPDPLYLIAHSRGGLVARLAARALCDDYRVSVQTYGTPHLGTPLANTGGKLLSALLAMGRTMAGGVFGWDPASLAIKTLLRAGDLPEGLDVMRTDSEALKAFRFGKEPFPLTSYGGEYDLRTLANGACAYSLGEVAYECFAGQPNDLVVPTASALGAGHKRPVVVPCNHFSYFSTVALKQEIQKLGG